MQSIITGFGTYTVEGDTVSIKWVASSYDVPPEAADGFTAVILLPVIL